MSNNPRITAVVSPVAHQILSAIAAHKGESLSSLCGSIVNEWVRQSGVDELESWAEVASRSDQLIGGGDR